MLNGYIGQEDRLDALKASINAYNTVGRKLPHMLFLGASGRGKTKLASEVAAATGKNMVVLHCPSVTTKDDVASKILEAEGGILFLDEVHALPRQIAEDLYTVIDENTVQVITEDIEYTKTVAMFAVSAEDLTPESGPWHGADVYYVGANPKRVIQKKEVKLEGGITIIGATTDEALLPSAFLSRLSQLKVYLRAYTPVELATICTLHVEASGATITPSAALYLAQRSRKTPRRVIQMAERALDFAAPKARVTIPVARRALHALGVDSLGLEGPHRQILEVLAEGSLSRTGLGQRLGINPTNLNLYWGELLEQGLVQVNTRHEITPKGLAAL